MSIFSGLGAEIKALNSNVKDVANSERAKQLRKKLLLIGISMAIIGFTGVLICMVMFMTAGFSGIDANGPTARIIVPFVLFMPCGIVGCIGLVIASYGFRIVVAGYTTKIIDETVGNNCPQCGDMITKDEIFCSKCGYQLRKECKNCQTINSHADKFCKQCGKEL